MGCCLSTSHSHTHKEEPTHHRRGRSVHQTSPSPKLEPPHPPVPVVEEESVKEVVLSETPVSKPATTSPKVPIPEKRKTHSPVKLEPEPKEISGDSQVSESFECEVSESFSYSTTTTVTEVRDDEEAMSKKRRDVGPRITASGSSAVVTRRKRPNSGELTGRRGRGHVSPVSKVDRSSEKRNRFEAGKTVRGRESGHMRSTQLNGGYAAGVRRDAGEVSVRRSRSPAPRAAGGVSRGGLARNASKGTGRAGGRSVGEVGENEDKKKEEVSKEGCSQLGNESLENPLVSLECFIFV
ncbi:hypothetical protein L484_022164 [Morus notabilis]|uniref:Uncharacterized protein n=1 Tax=Morus notabilis TaxID=981085 RepID=W9R073_9ROSA|nr:uncharacterized protein LOC21404986 [Morus notabilis]EXB62276.1 hypothetical protein L484_022164 [Morus notabilis]